MVSSPFEATLKGSPGADVTTRCRPPAHDERDDSELELRKGIVQMLRILMMMNPDTMMTLNLGMLVLFIWRPNSVPVWPLSLLLATFAAARRRGPAAAS